MGRFAPHPERRPAMVTGASSGIGAATARALAGAGHPVVLGARRVDRCEEVASEIRAAGGEAAAVRLDLADAASVDEFVRGADEALGPIEVLVANAAEIGVGGVLDTDPDDFSRMLQVNLTNAHRLVGLVARPMVERHRGDLVFVTSDVTRAPRPQMAAYTASKAGLEGYVRTLQMELEGTGVRAAMIRPGPTLTEMGWSWDPTETTRVIHEWERWGLARHDSFLRPEAIAEAVVFVVSAVRGVNVTTVEVQPEAPVDEEAT